MKPPRKPKTDDPTLDALISNMRASEALIEAMKAHGRAISSLIAVGARVAASCAELERRVGALEKPTDLDYLSYLVKKPPGSRIDETGNNEAGRR